MKSKSFVEFFQSTFLKDFTSLNKDLEKAFEDKFYELQCYIQEYENSQQRLKGEIKSKEAEMKEKSTLLQKMEAEKKVIEESLS